MHSLAVDLAAARLGLRLLMDCSNEECLSISWLAIRGLLKFPLAESYSDLKYLLSGVFARLLRLTLLPSQRFCLLSLFYLIGDSDVSASSFSFDALNGFE